MDNINKKSSLEGLDHIYVSLFNGEIFGISARRPICSEDLSELEKQTLSSGKHILFFNNTFFKLIDQGLTRISDNVIQRYYYVLG
jgi:hypothetical protein